MEKNTTITIPAILTRTNPMKDGGMNLGFQTNELSHEEKVLLMEKLGSFGWVAFRENAISLSDLPKEAEESGKTPSKRLRAILFVLYTQSGSKGDFEVFYRERMNEIAEKIKAKLD